ncbi:putative Positive regulator of sigma(E), RseC/MucC [Petrocella atlantisensis]|uniref:Putative Positive regulator of sigma(E), RseC/MucC n=1 Tax=Petrocella atlantisensis TaxID=2173034 RepID=A0A3P7P1M3_9FIRM|nr:SoxR reducing system RseC family protein [Petrocella atlantisensis]VDN49284.1 putative Positive regulator of sigma(E), RseC/MucC [Petrocella atlantisensis]
MKQKGYVVDQKGPMLTVQIARTTACGDKCNNCSGGCEKKVINVDLINNLDVSVGNLIEIETDTRTIIKSALVVYILPLVFMFLGMILVNYMLDIIGKDPSEILMLLGGIFFLSISLFVIKAIDHKISQKGSVFRITKIM